MKVVHIVHGKVNPYGHNGISRVVYYMNKYEKLNGCDSQIWAIVDGIDKRYTLQRDEFVTVECFPRVRLPIKNYEIIQQLISNKNSIDLVHFHLIWFYDKNIIASALKKAKIPFIITTHGTYSKPHAYTGKRRIARWLFELKYLKMAVEIHTITREEGTGLQKFGYTGPMFVAYNGIDLSEIPLKRSTNYFAHKPYNNKLKILWVGVLREDKNIRSLIKAVSLLPDTLRDKFVCILVGPDYKGNAKKYLKLCDDLGCRKNFDYLGPLYGQDKYDAIQSSEALVMPSFSEVFSLVILDAMACGKPFLATSGCGFNYFTQHNFSVRCEPYPQDIARGLEELFNRQAEWQVMGTNGRKIIEKFFEWSKIAKIMIENYERIINENR